MSEWSSGYVTDVGYTHGFYREMTPSILQFFQLMANAGGRTAPQTYCELGCGQGFSANILAAANPDISFHATDFNPTQIAGAQILAEAAGTKNVTFYDQSFSQFRNEQSLPAKFDVIALHGIYSWIGANVRKDIIHFIDERLKPGGIVYISYNALPGWAAAAPMRHLMYLHTKNSGGPTASRLQPALDFLAQMSEKNARYFLANPGVKERAAKLNEQNKQYLAHEYLNEAWTAFYHNQVATELSEARLSFLCSAHLPDHVDAINLTEDQRNILSEIADPTFREVTRDYMMNQQFRRDIFARGAVSMSVTEAREHWLDLRFALSTLAAEVPMKINGALGEANLQEEVYKPVINSLADGPKTVRTMAGEKAIADLGWAKLQQALIILAGAGHVQPCPDASGDAARRKSTRSFNLAVMNRARFSAELLFLASPITGGGIPVNRFEQLFLLAMSEKQDPVAFAWKALEVQGERIAKDGKAIEAPEDNIAELRARHETFVEKRLPILKQLGIA